MCHVPCAIFGTCPAAIQELLLSPSVPSGVGLFCLLPLKILTKRSICLHWMSIGAQGVGWKGGGGGGTAPARSFADSPPPPPPRRPPPPCSPSGLRAAGCGLWAGNWPTKRACRPITAALHAGPACLPCVCVRVRVRARGLATSYAVLRRGHVEPLSLSRRSAPALTQRTAGRQPLAVVLLVPLQGEGQARSGPGSSPTTHDTERLHTGVQLEGALVAPASWSKFLGVALVSVTCAGVCVNGLPAPRCGACPVTTSHLFCFLPCRRRSWLPRRVCCCYSHPAVFVLFAFVCRIARRCSVCLWGGNDLPN
jgi:hypothetical protein